MVASETVASLHAVLFACGAPVEAERLRELLGVDKEELNDAVARLRELTEAPESGVTLIAVENAYQLCTKPFVSETVKRALEMRKTPPLSKASLEVLAIIAYNQPVTRSFIEMVRGIDSSAIVASLCDKGLISERGYLDAPGHPILFGTTDAFLRCFGLESIRDLPAAELPVIPEQVTMTPETDGEGETPAGETPAEQTPAEQTPAEQTPAKQAEDLPAGEAPESEAVAE